MDNLSYFLMNPAQVFANLVPDKDGFVEINLKTTQGFSCVQIVLSTPFATQVWRHDLTHEGQKDNTVVTRDLTQKSNLKKGKYYSILRNSQVYPQGDVFKVSDITSTEFTLVDSAQKLFDIMVELSKFCGLQSSSSQEDNLDEKWSFLVGWQKLTDKEKLKKFNEMMSHELNVFLYFKDKQFFADIVKPHLVNKIEKDIVDYFLTDQYELALQYYGSVERMQELNAFEVALVVYMYVKQNNMAEAQRILQGYEDLQRMVKHDKERDKKLFDIVLNQQEQAEAEIHNQQHFGQPISQPMAMISNTRIPQQAIYQQRAQISQMPYQSQQQQFNNYSNNFVQME